MVYCLSVLYNSLWNQSFFPYGFREIVFDNSTQKEIQILNQKRARASGVIYITQGTNVGLAKAYNFVFQTFLSSDDWLVILDSDNAISETYFAEVNQAIRSNEYLAYTPINIDNLSRKIDSPRKIVNKFLFTSSQTSKKDVSPGFLMTINNGFLVSKKAFDKVGGYNENLFLYFVDSCFSMSLYFNKIQIGILNYKNECDFSFHKLPYKKLKNKLSLMKSDASVYYRWLYQKTEHPLRYILHYLFFNIKKSAECAKATSFKYFFSYLFARRIRK